MLQKFIAKLNSYLDRIAPGQPVVQWRRALVISAGVGIAVLAIEFMNLAYGTLGVSESMVLAVFGVTALLIFLFPNSMMYSPLTILEANLFASFVALTCVYIMPIPILGLIICMLCTTLGLYLLNCIHPPAFFLGVVIVMAGVDSLDFAFYPLMVDSLLLSLASYLYRSYLNR
ncbi:hypothetical protein DCO17_03520 [Polynucleobacter tropicus]|uniref:HPP transmembrane region domain-containing protein n=1 Tax=Polynucleobacter tropicus TaxID=1743174 RepID=A0A6M9PUP6_9BURK|nr:HPP family protein [Polynucleobacter tropicus]QKM64389.1 hypothetical protein DCO17_03520 [Polynucleobacter tropicus]